MIIKKTITKTYDIYDCVKWGMTVRDTISARERKGLKNSGLDRCFVCGKKFDAQIAITSWTPRGKNLGHGWSRRIYP